MADFQENPSDFFLKPKYQFSQIFLRNGPIFCKKVIYKIRNRVILPSFLSQGQKEVLSMNQILVCVGGIIIRQPVGR